MLLIFGNYWNNRWQFINLMPKRRMIFSDQRLLTVSTDRRNQRNDFVALFARNQNSLMSFVTLLPAMIPRAFGFVGGRFAVWMNRARRNRRILRRQSFYLRFQFNDSRVQLNDMLLESFNALDQRKNERSNRRSHLGVNFGRNLRVRLLIGHDKLSRVPNRYSASTSILKKSHPSP